MLTIPQFRVLCVFREVYPSSMPAPSGDKKIVTVLVSLGALRVTATTTASYPPRYYFVPSVGEPLIQELEQFQRQKAENDAKRQREKAEDDAQCRADLKQQRRHEWRIAAFSACAGSILTLFIEHFSEILVFFRNLF
jgi:hypothetical protein